MKIQLQNTNQIVEINGVRARVWTGHTEQGIEIECVIMRVAVHRDADCSQFENELQETTPLNRVSEAFSARMVL